MVKLFGRLAQMVKAYAKTTSCKPLSRRYEFNSSQGQFVCLDMFVKLLPAGQGGFTVHRACLEDGHMYWLSSTSTALVTAACRKPEDHWSCIAHLIAEDVLKSAVIEEKKFKNIECK